MENVFVAEIPNNIKHKAADVKNNPLPVGEEGWAAICCEENRLVREEGAQSDRFYTYTNVRVLAVFQPQRYSYQQLP